MTSQHVGHAIDALRQDVRLAVRALARAPGFASVAILTLALGIGASTALFSVGYGVLLRPLPYADADRLVVVLAEQDFDGAAQAVQARFPFAALADWPSRGRTFERVGFFSPEVAALSGSAGSELIDIAVVSGTFFDTLQGELALGRPLAPGDDTQPVAVISERLWRRHFDGSPSVLQQSLALSGQPYTIVGIARETLQVPQPQTEAWIPAGYFRSRQPACCGFTPLLRVTGAPVAVTAEVRAIADALAAAMPRALGGARVTVVTLRDLIVGDSRAALLVLGAAVALLLVLACANVVNLVLARATVRAPDVAVRRALGAPRRRLVAQALAESAVLASASGVLGVALAATALTGVRTIATDAVPRLDVVRIDGVVLLFALLVSTVMTMAVAFLPMAGARDVPLGVSLQARGAGRPQGRVALQALTVSQLAISIVLLVGAALLGRSLAALMATDLGVRPDGVATASLNLAITRSLSDRQQRDLVDRVVARIAAQPGVIAAGAGTARPPDVSRMRLTLRRGDETRATYQAQGVPVTPGYFAALGVRLERGRLFTDADTLASTPVAIMSAGTARRLFGDQDPIGRTIGLPVLRDGRSSREDVTIVGLTAGVKYGGLDRAADDIVYRPFAQQPWRSLFLVARTSADPMALAAELRHEIAAVDRDITVSDVSTLDAVLFDATARPRLRTRLLAAFAFAAVVIAGIGLYGVIAYSVSRRSGELAIRVALGADARSIRRLVIAEGLTLVGIGSAAGLLAAAALARLVSSLLYGITPADPVSYALAATGVGVCGLVASYVPAARASRTDPLSVLRAE